VIFFAVFAAVFFVVFLVVGAVGWDEVVGPAGDVGPGGGAEGRFPTHLGSMTMWVGSGSRLVNLTLAAAMRRARRRSDAILWSIWR